MRIVIAGIIGGVVFFVWGVVAHVLLPLGETGIHAPRAEDAILANLPAALGEQPGIYILPWLGPEAMGNADAVKAYAAKATASPYAFVVYQPHGRDQMQMGVPLLIQFVGSILAAWLIAFALSASGPGFRRRALISAAIGVVAWLVVSMPQWNWYRFPLDYTLANLVELVVGWLLAGLAMAWWLGRREPA